MATHEGRMEIASEAVLKGAEEAGRQLVGIPKGGAAALNVLTEALAKAMADAVHFGADDNDRIVSALIQSREQLEKAFRAQLYLRKGRPRG